jgi:hypothetical protein
MSTDDIFSTHPHPVWRAKSDFLVLAPLVEQARFEQLWCRKITETSFEVCCVPFFLYNIALGDVVETQRVGTMEYVVHRVIEASGRFVFRAHFQPFQRDFSAEVISNLQQLGALVESSSSSLLAIDAVDGTSAQEIANYLAVEESSARLTYETGSL